MSSSVAMATRGQDVEPTVLVKVGPALEASPDGWVMQASAYFLNTGSRPLSVSPPMMLRWLFKEGKVSGGGFLDPIDPESGNREWTIEPGKFLRRDYRGRIPLAGEHEAVVIFPEAGPGEHRVATSSAPHPLAGTTGTPADVQMPVAESSPVGPRELPGQSFFRRHFAGHEPMYFVWGPESPNLKFQVSLRYKIINPDVEFGRWWQWSQGLHFAYTQTSLWDFDRPSSPFYDSSYKPEVLWRRDDLFPGAVSWWEQLGLQVGLQHESNGKDGDDSRSLNILYFKPTFLFGQATNLFLAVSPRAFAYVGEMPDNEDIADYRGYVDLMLKAGWATSVQVAGHFRVGDDFNRGSMQIDLSYPLGELLPNIDVFLHGQYFNGWGESLLDYDERTWMFRIGLSLFR
ncbi:MAG: phospholipase A [Verrucomicrobiales bacterium]|nr:phospholipase A [Verrucomicrobiales bacterium]